MSAISAARFIEFIDKQTAAFLALKGTVASGYGAGDASLAIGSDWGLSRKSRDAEVIVLDWEDGDLSRGLLFALKRQFDIGDYALLTPKCFGDVLRALSQVCADAGLTGVSTIDQFATYYNIGAGGPFTALLPPEYRDLHYKVFAAYPTVTNLYAPAITNMGQRTITASVAGSYTDGDEPDTASYGGVARLQSTTTSWAGSSGTLSVAVAGYNASGVAATGAWTGTIAGNGTVVLTPDSNVKLVTDVTGITFPGTMTDGTIVIAGLVPSGRTAPPA